MQLVIYGNRIIAHGNNYLAMGNVVINTETGAKYENATIAECEGCPPDIDKVGYEYHAGRFIPCAPFGEGVGNVAVVCDTCNTIKNSGFPISSLFNPGHIYETSYKGNGDYGSSKKSKLSDPLPFVPKVMLIARKSGSRFGILFDGFGISFDVTENKLYSLTSVLTSETPSWYSSDNRFAQLNESNENYRIIAIG